MKNKKWVGKIARKVYDKILSEEFKEGAKMREEDFTRNRKVNFPETILFILSGTKKSLQSAVYTFFKEMKIQEESYSKQAFSKGRQRIKPEAFRELFDTVTTEFYENAAIKKYRGFRVLAIDGTKYNLPNTPELTEKYGIQKSTNQVQALGSCLYDVLNGMLLDVQLFPYNANERILAALHIDSLTDMAHDKELLLMDRGYPSADLLKKIADNGLHFVARCDFSFIKAMSVTGDDCTLEHKFLKGICSKLRVVRFRLKNGADEILVTNIFDEDFKIEDFKAIYHLRWGIEEKYDDLKNKLQIENFSGTTAIAVLQDFYATMFLSNLASAMVCDYADEIDKKYNTRELKYKYKANISMTISLLKADLIELLTVESDRKRTKLLNQLYARLMDCVVPIRDDRSYPHNKKHLSLKFPNNRKSL